MKIELTPAQAAQVRPLLRDCAGMFVPRVVLGQLVPGDWRDPEKIFLHYCTIQQNTARKIRSAIQKEQNEHNKNT